MATYTHQLVAGGAPLHEEENATSKAESEWSLPATAHSIPPQLTWPGRMASFGHRGGPTVNGRGLEDIHVRR